MQSSIKEEPTLHPECDRFKVKVDVDLYISGPNRDEAELFAMKYVRRGLSLNFQQGFKIDVPVHIGTGLIKQGRVSIYRPRTLDM